MPSALFHAHVLVVGVGGLGCPAARVLARSGVGRIVLCDDDFVDETNLHRQILFRPEDEGAAKAERAAVRLREALGEGAADVEIVARNERILPDRALELVSNYDLVIEGADNFATKFLVADACALAGVPVVQAGAVRWSGWALGSVPGSSACLRCVFEDVPRDRADTCADAGVVGPVVGVLGALQAAIALRLLGGDRSAAGTLFGYDALAGSLRARPLTPRSGCELCNGRITDTDMSRYVPQAVCPSIESASGL
jgi:molybdopterin-synthase adenylyltransferase